MIFHKSEELERYTAHVNARFAGRRHIHRGLYAECRHSYKWECLCTEQSFSYKHKAFSSVGKLVAGGMNLRKAQTQLWSLAGEVVVLPEGAILPAGSYMLFRRFELLGMGKKVTLSMMIYLG